MNLITPEILQSWTSGQWKDGLFPQVIGSIQFNSKSIKTGDIFVALTTGLRDGHDFVQAAMDQGASAVIVKRPLPIKIPQLIVADTLIALQAIGKEVRNLFDKEVIAIVGSFGKTSTKSLLSKLFGDDYFITPGNLNNYIGVPVCLSRLDSVTCGGGIFETGINQVKEMDTLGEMIRPTQVVFTGVGMAHLEGLGSLDGVATEKCRIFHHLYDNHNAVVYFHLNCLDYKAFQKIRAGNVYVFGEVNETIPAGFPVEIFKQNFELIRYCLDKSDKGIKIHFLNGIFTNEEFVLPLMSSGMVRNAILSIGIAFVNGISASIIRDRLLLWKPDSMRGERIQQGNKEFYVDCYNANPESVRDSLNWFRSLYPMKDKLIILASINELGENASTIHHELMKELGLESNEKALFIGEFAESYAAGLTEIGIDPNQYRIFEEIPKNDSWLDNWSGPIYLKGSRSYQLEKIIKDGVSSTC